MTQLSTKYPQATARVICDFLNEPDFGNLRWEAQPSQGLPGITDMFLQVMDLVYPVASSEYHRLARILLRPNRSPYLHDKVLGDASGIFVSSL